MTDSYAERRSAELLSLKTMVEEAISRMEYVGNKPVRGDFQDSCKVAIKAMWKSREILQEMANRLDAR